MIAGPNCRWLIPWSMRFMFEASVFATPEFRRTCAGPMPVLPMKLSINYFKKLGITAVELLPIHHFIDEGQLVDKGLTDYWGYNTLGFFAPMSRYSSSATWADR